MRPRGRGRGHTRRELSVGKTGAVCPAPACGAGPADPGCPDLGRFWSVLAQMVGPAAILRQQRRQSPRFTLVSLVARLQPDPPETRTRHSQAETCPRVRGKLKSSLTNKLQSGSRVYDLGEGLERKLPRSTLQRRPPLGPNSAQLGGFWMLSLNRSYDEMC